MLEPVAIEAPAQQSRGHGGVDDHSRLMRRGPRNHVAQRPPLNHRQLGLHGVDMANRLAALQLIDVEVRHADPPDLSLIDQLGHRRPRLLQRRAAIGDRASGSGRGRAARRPGAAGSRRIRRGSTVGAGRHTEAVRPRLAAALRAHEHRVGGRITLQRPPDDLLSMSKAVDRGRVDPVDASSTARRIAAIDSASSTGPQPNRHGPPIAHVPRPRRVNAAPSGPARRSR